MIMSPIYLLIMAALAAVCLYFARRKNTDEEGPAIDDEMTNNEHSNKSNEIKTE